jgi:hypothetical protein
MVTFKQAHNIRIKTGYIITYCSPMQSHPISTVKANKNYHYYATIDQPTTNIKTMYKQYSKCPTQNAPNNTLIINAGTIGWFYICYKKQTE